MTAAILLSGGMDSYALTFERRPDYAITIDYGQRPADAEIVASEILVNRLEIPHEIVRVDMRHLGSGDLSESAPVKIAPASDWWPFRNQMLVTIAAMKLVSYGVKEILVAAVESDSTHVDGTDGFFKRCDALLAYQEGGVRVMAPATTRTTVDLIRQSKIPHSLLAWSHSCHTSNIACGRCRGCNKSREVFEELGIAEAY